MLTNEKELGFIRNYLELLNTIEKAFDSLEKRPMIERPEAINQLVPDIFKGWVKINEANDLIKEILREKPEVLENIRQFEDMVDEFEDAEDWWLQHGDNLFDYVVHELFPTYNDWKQKTESQLIEFVRH